MCMCMCMCMDGKVLCLTMAQQGCRVQQPQGKAAQVYPMQAGRV